MRLKKIRDKQFFFDLTMGVTVIINTAFFDVFKLLVSSEIFFFLISFFIYCSRNRVAFLDIKIMGRIIVFFIYGFLSIFWAKYQKEVLIHTISIGQIVMLSFCLVTYLKNENDFEKILFAFVIASFLLIARIMTTTSFVELIDSQYYFGYKGVNGINRTHVGMVGSYSALILYYFKKKYKASILLIPMIIMFIFSFSSGSRKGVLLFIIGFLVLYYQFHKFEKKQFLIILGVLFISLGIYLAINYIPILKQSIGLRLDSLFLFLSTGKGDDSAITRVNLIKQAFIIFCKNPIFGIGLDNFEKSNSLFLTAHNNYMEILCDLGIIGLILYYYLPIKTIIHAIVYNRKEKNDLISLLISILIAMLVADCFTVSFEMEYVQILLCTMLVGGKRMGKKKINTEGKVNVI